MTILFADVANSVALHEALGDLAAHEKIVNCLNHMAGVVSRHNGQVVETIGDEIMCTFCNVDDALRAACAIQESLRSDANHPMSARVGFNHGLTNIDHGHPFGDTVNIAARMVELAKEGQIIISDQAYQNLSPINQQQTRYFNFLLLKGKQDPCDVYEVLWDRTDRTVRYTRVDFLKYNRHFVSSVKIKYLSVEKKVTVNNTELQIGRGNHCDLQVFTGIASRLHATIRTVQGKIVFADQSTNGSFIRTRPGNRANDALDVYLHHEEWIMSSSGVISLGEPVHPNNRHLIQFQCA